jgi:hypothetical protein
MNLGLGVRCGPTKGKFPGSVVETAAGKTQTIGDVWLGKKTAAAAA